MLLTISPNALNAAVTSKAMKTATSMNSEMRMTGMHHIIDKECADWAYEHFTAEEMACKCRTNQLLPHKYKCTVSLIDPELMEKLELLREMVGHPITVHSGYRCPAYNAAIGGNVAKYSYHMRGMAADIAAPRHLGMGYQDDLFTAAQAIFTYCYQGTGFIHVDIRDIK